MASALRDGAARLTLSLLVASSLAATPGCKGQDSGPQQPAASSAQKMQPAAAPAAAPPEKPFRRAGLVGMMLHLAHEQALTEAQKASLRALQDRLRIHDETAGDAFRELQSDLVAGIRTGKIDGARMSFDCATADAALQARRALDAETLNGLHAALDPATRKALVSAARTMRAVHALRPPGSPDEKQADWTKRRLERLTADLGLDAAQRARVAALVATSGLPTAAATQARKDDEKRREGALLAAFEEDAFDATETGRDGGTVGSTVEMVRREVQFLSQLLPLLKPGQREKLAATRQGRGPGRQRTSTDESSPETAPEQQDGDNTPTER